MSFVSPIAVGPLRATTFRPSPPAGAEVSALVTELAVLAGAEVSDVLELVSFAELAAELVTFAELTAGALPELAGSVGALEFPPPAHPVSGKAHKAAAITLAISFLSFILVYPSFVSSPVFSR